MSTRKIFSVIVLFVCVLRVYELKIIADDGMRTNAIEKSVEVEERDEGDEDPWRLVDELKAQIAAKESALANAEALNHGFESIIQLISVMGQVDAFLANRTRLLLTKLAPIAQI